jgi:hypothetical protein
VNYPHSHPAYLLTGAPIPLSTNDPDSTYLTKGNRAAELGYFDNYLINNESCVMWGCSHGRPLESGECGDTRYDRSLLRTIWREAKGGGSR